MKCLLVLAAGIALLAPTCFAQSGASQDVASEKSGSLFHTLGGRGLIEARTASRKGDILTIVISENVQGNFTASTSTTKKDSTATSTSVLPFANFVTGPVLNQLLGKNASLPKQLVDSLLGANSTGANASMSGTGTTSTNGSFSTTVSVIVKEVTASGNLVIEGQRWVKINKELQSLIFTGLVRRDDVRLDNTVLSTQVANARLEAEGKGAIAERQRKGILNQILDWLF